MMWQCFQDQGVLMPPSDNDAFWLTSFGCGSAAGATIYHVMAGNPIAAGVSSGLTVISCLIAFRQVMLETTGRHKPPQPANLKRDVPPPVVRP